MQAPARGGGRAPRAMRHIDASARATCRAAPKRSACPALLVATREIVLVSFSGFVDGISRDVDAATTRTCPVRNSIAYGWRVAVRTTLLQCAATLATALAATPFGWRAAGAAMVGGLIIAAGSLVFAVRLFGRGVVPARTAVRSAYAAEVLKWLWLCVALTLAIAVFKLPFPGLIAGVLAAQLSFWIALIAIR